RTALSCSRRARYARRDQGRRRHCRCLPRGRKIRTRTLAAVRRISPAQRDGELQGARMGMSLKMSGRTTLPFLLTVLALLGPAQAEPTETERMARWSDLKHAMFGDRVVDDGGGLVAIDAPDRAEDAAIVPVAIQVSETLAPRVRGLYLVIDDNPSPLAAHFVLGP